LVPAFGLYPPLSPSVYAQDQSISATEGRLKDLNGIDKLKALNNLTSHYAAGDPRKALRYGRQAVSLGENLFLTAVAPADKALRPLLLEAYFQLGEILYDREDYFASRDQLVAARSLALQLGTDIYEDELELYLEEIQDLIDEGVIKESLISRTIGDIKVGEILSETTKDLSAQAEVTMAQQKEKKGDLNGALVHYEKAVKQLRDAGNAGRVVEVQMKIAEILDVLGRHIEAQKFLTDALGDLEGQTDADRLIASPDTASRSDVSPENSKIAAAGRRDEQQTLIDLAKSAAGEKDFEKSLAYHKLYQELSQKMEKDSLQSAVESKKREGEIVMLRQQKQIADLNVSVAEKEKEKQIRLRNMSAFVAILILASSLITLYFYLTKKREHKRLKIAYRDLDNTKSKLVGAERRIVKLLRQHVSGDVAKELLTDFGDKPVERRFVCIMFLDIRDFTPMAEQLSPEEIIAYQNKVFGFMIDIVHHHHGNINQLLGDGFMATFGAPVSRGNDCQNAFTAANDILKEVKERNDAGDILKTKVGIGLHAGYVVTGNVGNESRKQYSVTGNPVIIASRVEQLNKEYQSQLIITEEVYEKLDKPLKLTQPFLEVVVKGRTHPVRILKIA
jgi:class 3 adenylate cyclase